MTLEEMHKNFEAAKTFGAAAVMVRIPQALALLDCAKALSIVRDSCGNAGEAEMRTALAKLKEAGVTI